MAELSLAGYRSGSSLLYRIDVRFKLLFVVLVGLACLKASFLGLAVLSLFLAAAIFDGPLNIGAVAKSLRWVFALLVMVFIARLLSEPGDPLATFHGVTATRQGLYQGVLVCWRLLLIIVSGVLLSTTTRAADLTAGVAWLLGPLPLIPAQRVATMMGLILRFMPLVLDQAREIAAAQRARGVENRKNPFYRLKVVAVPLLRKSFERADRLALAMEARCYREQPRDAGLSAGAADWAALVAVGAICLAGVLL